MPKEYYLYVNGQWLKSITFKLPIIDEDLNISLDNDKQDWWGSFFICKNIKTISLPQTIVSVLEEALPEVRRET